MQKSKAKILILDIETAPALVNTWGLFKQNHGINQVVADQYMLCWSAKWFGEKEVLFDSIFNHKKEFKKDPRNDLTIAKGIWDLMNEADICVAHYGTMFDFKWLNTLFLRAGLPPVHPYKVVDTKFAASKNFKFLSNKLDFIGRRLGCGKKVHHDGFDLWDRCMAGDEKSWKLMQKYNEQDVKLLEKVYVKLRPFMKRHPNLAIYDDTGKRTCSNCGSHRIKSKGIVYHSAVAAYRSLICIGCGTTLRENENLNKGKKHLRKAQ